jgi:hypothetical protein
MMMAHTSDTPPPALDVETIEAVRAALTRYVREGNHTADLRGVLLRVSAEARAKGILPERLLIVLKEIWSSLPDVRHADRGQVASQNVLLQRLITRCIEQYYEAEA